MIETASAALLFVASCICCFRTRFVQFRRFGASVRGMAAGGNNTRGISPLAASATSLAASLGTGNIAGVAGAIVLGGPGAVFWMWMSALAGMGAKYCDIYYGMRYRSADCIGPMAYMERALPRRFCKVSLLYAGLCATGCLCMGNLVQVNAMSEAGAALAMSFGAEKLAGALPMLLGLSSAAFVLLVQLGGAKRVGNAASLLVPIMSLFYIGAALVVLFMNVGRVPEALISILRGASEPRAILTGIARGTFSHEAGLGTAAIAHAGCESDNAHRQALFGVFEVFFDTIVMCSITALAVLVALPSAAIPTVAGENSTVVIAAFAAVLGEKAAAWCVTLSLVLFAITSILSFSHYGGVCARYLLKTRGEKCYRFLFLGLLCVGGEIRAAFVWDAAQWVNIAMGLTNMGAMLFITGTFRRGASRLDTGSSQSRRACGCSRYTRSPHTGC